MIVHGAIKIITVREGVFGVSYDEGVMSILGLGDGFLIREQSFAGLHLVEDDTSYRSSHFNVCRQRWY